jgi:hypothetical protein
MPALSVKDFGRFVALFVGALVGMMVAPFATGYLFSHANDAPWIRFVAVVAGTACYAPWIVLVGWLIRKSDEFDRQKHLIGIAYSFALTFVLFVAIGLLKEAGFIDWGTEIPVAMIFIVAWGIGLLVAARQFRARE